MPPSLLHLITPAGWRAALAAGELAPPSLREVGFVHLSAPHQIARPAEVLFADRRDLVLLAVDPAGLDVRWEPGTHGEDMHFPHAYGPVPTSAVVAVLPYRPGPAGFGPPPPTPGRADTVDRAAAIEPSLLRRTATAEVPVAGGVAVLTAPVPASYQHNQLLVHEALDAAELAAEADRVLGGAAILHRRVSLLGSHLASTAAELEYRGWDVEPLVVMAATPATPPDGPAGRVEELDLAALRPMWDVMWHRELPGVTDVAIAQLSDRYRLEEAVIDLRFLAVREGAAVVASCLLKIDGATALLDAVSTQPDHRGRGHGDALLTRALALAAGAGCDLVVLTAAADDWPRHWYGRRGFREVDESWSAGIGG